MFATAFQDNAFQVNAFQIGGLPPDNVDTHDGISKDELKRIRALQKQIKKTEEARNKARIEAIKARKNAILEAIEPTVVKEIQNEVESQAEVRFDTPSSDLRKLNAEIRNLERQKAQLLQAIAYRQEIARVQTELAILEAKAKAEQDDEEALLLLM